MLRCIRVPSTRNICSYARFARNFSSRGSNARNELSKGGKRTRVSPYLLSGLFLGCSILSFSLGKMSSEYSVAGDSFKNGSTTALSDILPPKYCTDEEMVVAINEIKKELGNDSVTDSKTVLDFHSENGFTTHPPSPNDKPKYVIYATTTEEVSKIMKILFKYNVPVVPFSGGSSLEGHFFSTRQGVILNTSKMNKVKDIHEDDLDAVVEAGVNWQDLNKTLNPYGLMFGTDCGPSGLIGGMVNTNASGINASKYGAMISNVISLTVVLADGTIVKTKQRPRKSSSGYNLTGLFIGSEGTLGIVTEITVKLHVKPKHETVVVAQFPSILNSTRAVSQLFKQGIQPNAMELLDSDMMHCINYSGYFTKEWLECPSIFFKIGGRSKNDLDEQVSLLRDISMQHQCQDFIFARNQEEGDELFSARKNAFYAMKEYAINEIDRDCGIWVTDIAVPLSKFPYVLSRVDELIKSSNMFSIVLAHAGDGNFHADIFYKPDEKEKCASLVNKMMLLGLENEGTATGEHGIGNGKRKYLELELGPNAVNLMRRIKLSMDPKRILNPDKVFKIDPLDSADS